MKIEKLLLITGIAFSVWSCSKTDEEQVREVATSFLTAAAEQDFEEAASYCDESTKELLNSLQGLIKAAAAKQADPLLAQFDASQRSLSCANGCSFKRWKFGVDVQLLKGAGNHQADKMRTILCLECDHNMNNKKIGRTAMWNGERATALARDNLGGRKGMRAVEVSMNQHLSYNLIWASRARAVIISNDAKGCFDRIAHVVAILALRRLGVRPAP